MSHSDLGIRAVSSISPAGEHPYQLAAVNHQSSLFKCLSNGCLCWTFAWFNPTAGQAPTTAVGALHEKNFSLGIKNGRFRPNLGVICPNSIKKRLRKAS